MDRINFSLVLPTRNRARFLPTTLATLLPQMEPNDELVISDNHSTDATLAVLGQLTAHLPNVRIIHPQQPLEIYPHWHFAISNATCDHVVLVNDDELYHHRLLSCARQAFAASPKISVAVGGIAGVHCYAKGRLFLCVNRKQYPSFTLVDGWDWWQHQNCHAPGNCILFRKPPNGFRFLDQNPPAADTVMYYQLARRGLVATLPICTTTHLIHGTNAMHADFANQGKRYEAHLVAAEDSPNANFSLASIERKLALRHFFLMAHLHAARRGRWDLYRAVMKTLQQDWPGERIPSIGTGFARYAMGRFLLRGFGYFLCGANELRRLFPPSRILSIPTLAAFLEQPPELVRAHLRQTRK